MFDIWNKHNELADAAFENGNYKIDDDQTEGKYCIIYCSSNNIWFPNEKEAFVDSIIKNDRYEWSHIRNRQAKKIVYVRDIYKSWYVTGINKELDNIDKLIDFLKNEIKDLPVIVIGSSAGGYLASILGFRLKAKYVIAFSAQFELKNEWAMSVNPFLQKYQIDKSRSKYYDLKDLLKSCTVPIYYIVPQKSVLDSYHYNYIKEIDCVHPLVFRSSHHGVVIPKCCLEKFISQSETEIENLFLKNEGKVLSPISFSISYVGLFLTTKYLLREFSKKVKRFFKKI